MKSKIPHNEAWWALVIQGVGLVVLSPLAWVFKDKFVAGSLLMGGAACLLPNVYLYHRVFKYFGARHAHKMLKALYWGEVVKLLLTGAIFGVGLSFVWIKPLYLFLGYLYAQVVFWLAPVIWGFRGCKKRSV